MNIDDINKRLKYKVFKDQKDDLVFTVEDIQMHISTERDIVIRIKHTYLPKVANTYFANIPSELSSYIGSMLNNVDDIESICASLDTCNNNFFWRELFRYNFPQVHQGYVNLGYVEHMNMSSYKLFLSLWCCRGKIMRGSSSDNYLDYFAKTFIYKLHKGDPDVNKTIVANVILNIKHPRLYRIFESNPFLKNNLIVIVDILINDVNPGRNEYEEILSDNRSIDTFKLLNADEPINMDLGHEFYVFALLLDFTGIHVNERVIQSIISILDIVANSDKIWRDTELHKSLTQSLGPEPLSRLYIDKIKKENPNIYEKLCKISSSYACVVLNDTLHI